MDLHIYPIHDHENQFTFQGDVRTYSMELHHSLAFGKITNEKDRHLNKNLIVFIKMRYGSGL